MKRKGQSTQMQRMDWNGIKAIVSSQMRLDAAVHVRYIEQMLGWAVHSFSLAARKVCTHSDNE